MYGQLSLSEIIFLKLAAVERLWRHEVSLFHRIIRLLTNPTQGVYGLFVAQSVTT